MNYPRYLCFAETYTQARECFAEGVAHAGGELTSFTHPDVRGPKGEALATDTAWFGSRQARAVLLTVSGTHGQEFFAGAATQLHWMAEHHASSLPADVAVCFIHAHNPYGAAYHSRSNENNVDLNRNFFSAAIPRREPKLYAALHSLLFTDTMNEQVMVDVMARYYAFAEQHDLDEVIEAMGAGQNSHPDGNIYCGTALEWSTRTLQAVLDTQLHQAEKVAVIDWHTGLGEFGKATFLLGEGSASEQAWAEACWGRTFKTGAQLYPQEKGRPRPKGLVHQGIADRLRARGAEVASTVAEWGTYENSGVLAALLIDRWLRAVCTDRDAPEAVALRTKMMERLNPSMPEWRQSVLTHSSRIHRDTLAGLTAWLQGRLSENDAP